MVLFIVSHNLRISSLLLSFKHRKNHKVSCRIWSSALRALKSVGGFLLLLLMFVCVFIYVNSTPGQLHFDFTYLCGFLEITLSWLPPHGSHNLLKGAMREDFFQGNRHHKIFWTSQVMWCALQTINTHDHDVLWDLFCSVEPEPGCFPDLISL